ncbi:MAG: hypothetical protein AAGF77_14425 [Bacteroidota bacterium]
MSIFVFAILLQANAMGFFVFIGFGVLSIYAFVTYLKNYFYRAFFIDMEGNFFVMQLLSFSGNYESVEILEVKKMFYPRLYVGMSSSGPERTVLPSKSPFVGTPSLFTTMS